MSSLFAQLKYFFYMLLTVKTFVCITFMKATSWNHFDYITFSVLFFYKVIINL